MAERSSLLSAERIETWIHEIRGERVILDVDLARVYGVPTRVLNQAVRRNKDRFPSDFAFQLMGQEVTRLRSQFVISNSAQSAADRSQSATGSSDMRGGRRYLPWAFTEHGAIMAANVLNSARAVAMSVYVIRAFVRMRSELSATQTLERRLAAIENALFSHDAALRDLFRKIRPLLLPSEEPPRRPIGFHVKDRRARYAAR